ncbi:MAG: hypothetical protein WAW54_17525 [Parvibaculum sedimenti]|uniref:hypothetical protein n=1 Tax=Parvibaculum sedimenti TaxID=2608632 RepID=UPI003BB7C162
MTTPKMPRDGNNHSIPVLRPRAGGAWQGNAVAATSRVGPFTEGTRVISIWAINDVRFQTGDGTVVASATSHKLGAGERLTISLGGGDDLHTHIAVIRDGGVDTAVEVSEME